MHFFLKKVDDVFSRHLKARVFTVTTNAQNTLQHFQGASAPLAAACGSLSLLLRRVTIHFFQTCFYPTLFIPCYLFYKQWQLFIGTLAISSL